ncbi:RidA family protein [Edaphobacter aggregans]|uniref:RidA family protein n=1 Tax=Edaphobacter aggregans TaxID=570835 RepID=UPI00054F4E06|nr:RidA family protein [Edaphobacter aggregans]
MQNPTRRGILKNAAKAAVAAGGVLATQSSIQTASAQTSAKLAKKDATGKSQTQFPFTSVVSYGNLLFVSGIGCRVPGTIEENTKWVLDELEKNLTAAGSSLEKVLKVNIFMEDIKQFDRMNAVYKSRKWGAIFPARNTTQPAALPAGDYGLAIDCIAYV